MRTALLICAALLLAAPFNRGSAQAVWKWVDESGKVHYSDQPGPNAVKVDLNVQTYSSEEAAPRATSPNAPSAARKPTATTATYRTLQITSPAQDETIQGTGGQVAVQLNLDPALQTGHRIRVLLDGQPVGGESPGLSLTLPQVDRGTHTLQASVVSANGEMVIGSTAVTFHVRVPVASRPAR